MLQYTNRGCIQYAYSPLVIMGSEDRRVDDEGWSEDQVTGVHHVIAFSLLPIEVSFDGSTPVVLAPPTTAMTRPLGEYTRTPMNEKGQRTVFFAINTDTAREVAAFYDKSAKDREDPFPARSGPSSTEALGMALQMEQIVFHKNNQIDTLIFEDMALQIVGSALEAYCHSRGLTRSSLRASTLRAQREQVDYAIVRMCNAPDRRWTLGDLAAGASLSPTYLSRIFKRHSGKTLSKCLQLIRVIHAMERLGDCRGNLTGLALDSGFSSHAHMTSTFQNLLGCTPSQLAQKTSIATHKIIKSIRGQIKG